MITPTPLYLSKDYLILNKAPGVHYNEILTQSDEGWEAVHRLDYETSGALLFAKPDLLLATRELFQKRGEVEKIYLAGASQEIGLEEGSQEWTLFEGLVAGRYRSSKKVRYFFDFEKPPRGWHSQQSASLKLRAASADIGTGFQSPQIYEVQLLTGARHQIRAFFAAKDAALVGDPVYGKREGSERLELHAWKLSFVHPQSGENISATAAIEN